MADQLALTIDVPATIEWSPHVYGNGVMMMASAYADPVQQDDGRFAFFETVLTAGVTREAPVGAEKWSWYSKTASLKSDWTVDYPLQSALHPVSAASNTVTLAPLEDGVYSLVHVDWDTGQEVGRVILGSSPIFNTYPTDDGEPRVVPGTSADDLPIGWAEGGEHLFVQHGTGRPARVERVRISDGEREAWLELSPPDPAGVTVIGPIRMSLDGRAYAYSYRRVLDELYMVEGVSWP